MPVALLVSGYGEAFTRFADADENSGTRATARAYMGLFEALNRAVALDYRLEREWAGERAKGERWADAFDEGLTLRGVRHARNRVHHQWADALGPPVKRREGPRVSPRYEPPLLRNRPAPDAFEGLYDPHSFTRAFSGSWHWAMTLPPADPQHQNEADRRGQAAYDKRLAGSRVRATLEQLHVLFTHVGEAYQPE